MSFNPFRTSRSETGFLKRADQMLKDGSLSAAEEEYLKTHFIPSRDRVSSIATTVATVGTFVVTVLGIVVAVSGAISAQAGKAAEAAEAAALLTRECLEDTAPTGACTERKQQQAADKVVRETTRANEIGTFSRWYLVAAGLLLLGFLASVISHLANPLPPPALGIPNDEQRAAAWVPVRDRYRHKRNWVVGALLLDFVAVTIAFVLGALWVA